MVFFGVVLCSMFMRTSQVVIRFGKSSFFVQDIFMFTYGREGSMIYLQN